MAPLMHRDYHCIGDLNRYSLRTTKRGEEDFPKLHDVDASKINGKEDFFRCMGLQMKRPPCQRSSTNGSQRAKKLHGSNSVKLRDCSVVILGAVCKTCWKNFKCVSDVEEHSARRHCSQSVTAADPNSTDELRSPKARDQMCEIFSKPFGQETDTVQSPVAKSHRKLRLTLKIGPEVIVQISVKRKHLRMTAVDTATQTDTSDASDLIVEKDVQKGVVPSIDLPVFEDSPCRCCSPTVQAVNTTDRYLDADIVASNVTKYEGDVTQKDGSALNRLTVSRATSTCQEACAVPDVSSSTIAPVPDVKSNNSPEHSITRNGFLCKDGNPEKFPAPETDTMASRDTKTVPEQPETVSDHAVQTCPKDITKDANQNEIPVRKPKAPEVFNRVQVIMPVIVPIVVPNVGNTSVNTPEQRPPVISQQQTTRSSAKTEHDSDDEVQEVLRIVRPPNRAGHEMLIQDAIRDMIRMEKQGWHLLETESIETLRRKRSNLRNSVTNAEPPKKKRRVHPYSDGGNTQPRIAMEEKNLSNAREAPVKAQKPNHDTMYSPDNVKENLMTCNGNIKIPSEILRCYGITYCNETTEINNNVESVQQPISYFLGQCSGGMEKKSYKPAVIDLVNDTDE